MINGFEDFTHDKIHKMKYSLLVYAICFLFAIILALFIGETRIDESGLHLGRPLSAFLCLCLILAVFWESK